MGYLIGQILLCLIVAFALGFIIGCLFCRCKREGIVDDSRHEKLKREYTRLQREKEEWRAKYDALSAERAAASVAAVQDDDDYPYPVEEVEGIGKGFGNKLRTLGIETTEDLLRRCNTQEGWESVADKIGLKERYVVRKWASMSDLMRIPGVKGQFAELLEFSGVQSVQDLAGRDPAQLLATMSEVNEREHRVRKLPSLEAVRGWIAAAASLEPIMKL